jgi:hypothetical protein
MFECIFEHVQWRRALDDSTRPWLGPMFRYERPQRGRYRQVMAPAPPRQHADAPPPPSSASIIHGIGCRVPRASCISIMVYGLRRQCQHADARAAAAGSLSSSACQVCELANSDTCPRPTDNRQFEQFGVELFHSDPGGDGDGAVCRGAWARVTIDRFRHLALQTD